MKRLSRSVLVVLAATFVGLATMSFECGPPGRDIPCSDQIAEGDVLHIELVARYAPDGEIWEGTDYGGYGAIPSCEGIDAMATGANFDAKIHGNREDMLCTQAGIVPLWDRPRWGTATLPGSIVPVSGRGPNHVAGTDGAISTGLCSGMYGISLLALTNDVFAFPGTAWPYGTFVQRYFATRQPELCGPEFNGLLRADGATVCGDMYLVRVTR